MNAFFDRLAVWTVEKRWGVVLLLAVITAVSAVGHKDPQLLLSLFKKVEPQPEESSGSGTDDKQRVRVPDVDPFSLSRADAVIVVDCDDFFTPAGAQAMRQVVNDLEALDQVRRILWMDRVPILNIFGLSEPLFPRSESSQARFDDARRKALAHPLVAGQLLSLDAKTLLLLVSFDDRFLFEDADATTRLRETAEATAARFPDVRIRFQVTGRVPATIAAIEAHESNQTKFQLIGYGVILLMTIILFRGISAVVIVALAPALGVFWTLGMVRFLEYANNPLVDVILPILVSLVGLTDGVHLMVQIRKLRAAGHSEREAASQGLRQVGMACFLTSLTTAIGFGSLVVADSEWVWQFGVCSAIGVAVCFVAVVTVIPLLCASRLGRNIHVGYDDSLVDRHLSRVGVLVDVAYRHRRLLSLTAIGLTGLLFAVSMTLQPDQRQTDGLPQAAEATRALIHMDQALGGLEFSNVEVNWSDEVPSDSAEVLVAISEVDDLLKSEPLIGHPLSIRSLLDALPGSGPPGERMSMLELLPPPLKRAFFTPERRQAKVTFRVQDLGIAQYGPVFERIEAGLEKIHQQHPAFEFELEGAAVWRWRHLYQIVVDLATSLGTAAVIIFGVLTVVYRSIRIGLISVIPNMFPLVFTGAYLAMAGYNLEIVMVCSFTVCLGIAVDDTIHFLTRFQEERREFDQEQAICRAFTGVGTAMIMTTTVLVVGFSTVIISDSRDHRIFATMGVLTIGTALFGDLIFLPALLGQFSEGRAARLPAESDERMDSPPDREIPE